MTHAGKVSTDVQRRNRLAPINHGTPGGWKAHQRRGQEPCDECKAASSRARQDRKEREPQRDPMLARREQARLEMLAYIRRDAETQRGAA